MDKCHKEAKVISYVVHTLSRGSAKYCGRRTISDACVHERLEQRETTKEICSRSYTVYQSALPHEIKLVRKVMQGNN